MEERFILGKDSSFIQTRLKISDYTDTDFLHTDENPLVAYKAEINFKNLFVLAETGCVWTHVSYCSEPPVITSATATYEGETDSSGCAVVKVAWTLAQPSTTTLFAVTPCATVGDYDPYGSFAKKTTACLPDQTHVTYYVQPRDTATGCLGATVSADAQVPACNTYTCPTTTGVIETTVTVIGPADSAGANVNIQLVWGGSVGETTYIYRNDNGICTTSESYLYATIDDGSTSFEDTIPSGTLIKYKILSRTNCAGTDYTVGASNCIEVMTGPVTGQGSGTTHYYLTDHLGTVRAILDENGTVLSTHDYEPFGTELEPFSSDLTDNKYKYTGQERDARTGMDYMHARFYGSSIGRFLRPDPINGNPANPQSWNLYSYVRNNPVNATDPTGLFAMSSATLAYVMNMMGGTSGGGSGTGSSIPGSSDFIGPTMPDVNVHVYTDQAMDMTELDSTILNFQTNIANGVTDAFNNVGISIGYSFEGDIGVTIDKAGNPTSVSAGTLREGTLNVILSNEYWGAEAYFMTGKNHTGVIFLNEQTTAYVAREEWLHAFGICRHDAFGGSTLDWLGAPNYFNLALSVPFSYYLSPFLSLTRLMMVEEASRYAK